jgi:hypothetical protein
MAMFLDLNYSAAAPPISRRRANYLRIHLAGNLPGPPGQKLDIPRLPTFDIANRAGSGKGLPAQTPAKQCDE